MTDVKDKVLLQSDDAVEQLLGSAAPRPVPPADEARLVRAAVQSEWRRVTTKRRTRKRLTSLAIAASLMAAVFLSLNTLRLNGVGELTVASIGKRFGTIYLLGENSELLEGNNLATVSAGQTLITDENSGIGLEWGRGGSLRIDEDTRVEFMSDGTVYLRQGRVYYDSNPGLAGSGFSSSREPHLRILTDHGEVTHVGTQFMTVATATSVTVSVREGEVIVTNDGRSEAAERGEQLTISSGGSPVILNVTGWGTDWQWVEDISPSIILDDRTIEEFLRWVGHETGLEVRFDNATVETHAREEKMRGTVDTNPRQALQLFMQTTDLDWQIDDGVIYVDKKR